MLTSATSRSPMPQQWSNKRLLVLGAALLALLGTASAQTSCTTPNGGRQGTCIGIKECPTLLALIQKTPLSNEDRKLLLDSQCGTDGRLPKVCCELTGTTNPPPVPEVSCTTPDSRLGTCKTINTCQPLWQILQSPPISNDNTRYLALSQCGTDGKLPRVCCANDGQGPSTGGAVSAEDEQETGTGLAAESPLLPKDCGLESIAQRIIGGQKTTLREYPWMALLEFQKNGKRRFGCGGVLISDRYVLTAAHCVKGAVLDQLGKLVNVRLGEYDTLNDTDCVKGQGCTDPPVNVVVEQTIPHAEWINNDKHQYHDIALVRLAQPVKFTNFIKPICLANKQTVIKIGEVQWVAGWGRTENKSNSNIKLKLGVPIKTLDTCHVIYSQPKYGVLLREDIQICAGGETDKDSCQGDSGGPLMRFDLSDPRGPIWYAVGVVSFGPKPCAQPNWPGIYTNVPKHINWILSNMQ